MEDAEKRARRLLSKAAQFRKLEEQAERKRRRTPRPEPAPEKLYCVRCYAMLKSDSSCPRCDHHEANFYMYCRKCLRVHASLVKCAPWKRSAKTYEA